MLKVEYTPAVVRWAYQGNGGSASTARALLAVADGDSPSIRVYDPEKASCLYSTDGLIVLYSVAETFYGALPGWRSAGTVDTCNFVGPLSFFRPLSAMLVSYALFGIGFLSLVIHVQL